jgi:hypothetical protein
MARPLGRLVARARQGSSKTQTNARRNTAIWACIELWRRYSLAAEKSVVRAGRMCLQALVTQRVSPQPQAG